MKIFMTCIYALVVLAGPLTLGPRADVIAVQDQCARRQGPYVTQATAHEKRRRAIAQGYQVGGVYLCEGETYCFKVFVC